MKEQDLKRMEELLQETIEVSLSNNWNIHSAVGGKYGEVSVANALWKHGPLIGKERKQLGKELRNPGLWSSLDFDPKGDVPRKFPFLRQQ